MGLRMLIGPLYGPDTGAGASIKDTLDRLAVPACRGEMKFLVEGQEEDIVLQVWRRG
jgi:hypothetical protein